MTEEYGPDKAQRMDVVPAEQLRGAVAALEMIAHHQREGDHAGQVNAMRAIASEAVARLQPGGQ
jgi:hypothetical protein